MNKKENADAVKASAPKKSIIIDGKEYPCFQTLGANFDFKDVTGKEVSKIDPESITELAAYMWATIKGACTRQGIEFPYQTPRELAYHLDENSIVEWSAMMEANESKKKSTAMMTEI